MTKLCYAEGRRETQENIKNNLKISSSVGGNATNYILNGDFRDRNSNNSALYWTQTKNSVSVPATGIFSVERNTTETVNQYVKLSPGPYTLSMNVGSNGLSDTSVRIVVQSLQDPANQVTETLFPSTLFSVSEGILPSVTFEASNYSSGGEAFRITVELTTGDNDGYAVPEGVEVKINTVMLEKNIGTSPYSMVEFGNFESYSIDAQQNTEADPADFWTGNAYAPVMIESAGDPFGNVLKITGSLSTTKTVKQTVYRADESRLAAYNAQTAANAGDTVNDSGMTFLVSGFAKGTHQVENTSSYFRIRVDMKYYRGADQTPQVDSTYLDFQDLCNEWQFISGTVVCDEGELIYEIDIICEYSRQPGVAYFDDIVCSLDSYGNSTVNEYNEDGRITLNSVSTYRESYYYDDLGNVIKTANNRGEIYDYIYNYDETSPQYNTLTAEVYSSFYYGSEDNTDYPYWEDFPDYFITKTVKTMTLYTYNAYGQVVATDTCEAEGNDQTGYSHKSDAKHIRSYSSYDTAYDSRIFGALLTSTDSLGHMSRYFYDPDTGYLLATIDPNEKGLSYTYDPNGNIETVLPVTYSGSSDTWYPYPNEEEVTYEYDIQQRLTGITTGTTTYTLDYNIYSQNASVSVGEGANEQEIVSYEYHANGGKPEKIVYANGDAVKYVYDELDNISEIWYIKTVTGENGQTTTEEEQVYAYTYTKSGQLYRFDNLLTDTAVIYRYDPEGRLAYYTELDTFFQKNKLGSEIHYDDQNRLKSVSLRHNYLYGTEVHPFEQSWTYEYGADNTLQCMTLEPNLYSGDIDFTYDGYQRITQKVYDFGLNLNHRFINTVTYSYKDSGTNTSAQLYQYTTKVNNGTARTYTYTYDNNGNITKCVDSAGRTYRYKYDDLGQLIREDDVYRGYTYVYKYDNAGNLTTRERYALASEYAQPSGACVTDTYAYGDASWGDLLTAYNGQPITYDAVGNPKTWYDGSTYTWTQGRRLEVLEKGDYYLFFTYNDEGVRVSKSVNGTEHVYRVNGTQILQEEWGNSLLIYLYDNTGSPMGMLYRENTSAYGEYDFDAYWFERNAMGDVIAVYTDTGSKLVSYEYDAWGKIVKEQYYGSATEAEQVSRMNPFRYRGYFYDIESGLYYLNSRYYDPEIGRFINADGYVSTGQGLVGNNMYSYCVNNPVNFTDLMGTFAVTATVCGVVAYKIGILVVGTITALLLVDTLVNNPPSLPSLSKSDTDSKPKDIAVAIPKDTTEKTVIYRYGGTNPGNLTPSQRDVNEYYITGKGLSFSTIPRPGAAVTTIEALNATGIVYAVKDNDYHVSVFPIGGTLEEWHNAGSSSIWTKAVKSVVVKWDGRN